MAKKELTPAEIKVLQLKAEVRDIMVAQDEDTNQFKVRQVKRQNRVAEINDKLK